MKSELLRTRECAAENFINCEYGECTCRLFKERSREYRLRYLATKAQMEKESKEYASSTKIYQAEINALTTRLDAREKEAARLKQDLAQSKKSLDLMASSNIAADLEAKQLRQLNARFVIEVKELHENARMMREEIRHLNKMLTDNESGLVPEDHSEQTLREQLAAAHEQIGICERAIRAYQRDKNLITQFAVEMYQQQQQQQEPKKSVQQTAPVSKRRQVRK